MAKISTKICPECGDKHLIKYESLNKKTCSFCGANVPWELEEGQQALNSPRKLTLK